MHSDWLTKEELSLLLSPGRAEEDKEAGETAPDRNGRNELEKRVAQLEAALAEMGKRIAHLEDQLSVRQSAAALASAERTAERKEEPGEPARSGKEEPESPRATLSRVNTYKRGRAFWFPK
ncbi:hypothetical protein [Paenibacillus sp. GYB003]|uniref:hypothetical protein n=1 Tax=Paenibacillus sp. GYB003 TaxID=2994392 RepID=UPI002F9643CD